MAVCPLLQCCLDDAEPYLGDQFRYCNGSLGDRKRRAIADDSRLECCRISCEQAVKPQWSQLSARGRQALALRHELAIQAERIRGKHGCRCGSCRTREGRGTGGRVRVV